MSTAKPKVAGRRAQDRPIARCSRAVRSTAWARAIAPARTRTAPTMRPPPALEASPGRVTGRTARKIARAPTHRPKGTRKVAMICPRSETSLSRSTVSETGSAATSAAAVASASVIAGTRSAPDCSPSASDVAPEAIAVAPAPASLAPVASDPRPAASSLAPVVRGPAPAASWEAPCALRAIPDWMPWIPPAVWLARVVPDEAAPESWALRASRVARAVPATTGSGLSSAAVACAMPAASWETPPV